MANPTPPLFTPTEAAVLTRLPVKAVNNAIDKGTIATFPGRPSGRLLDWRALIALALERRLADRFVPGLRRQVFDALADGPRDTLSLDGGFLKIDLRGPRRELAISIRSLRRARGLVVTDPEIMGGEPVFRGTRIQVHRIASLLEQGETAADLLAGYPRLTEEMLGLAPFYAAAYPLRGRPRVQPWHRQAPARQSRRKMGQMAAE